MSNGSLVPTDRLFWFRLLAAGSVIAALYHVAGALGFLADNNSPVWRHILFVVIDGIAAWYLLRRPLWMFPLYVILFIQQSVTHGSHAIRLWRHQHIIDNISAVDLVALSAGLLVLTLDLRDRLRNPPAHNGPGV